jgi:hypothetical protein
MLNNTTKQAYVVLGALGVVALAVVAWHVAANMPPESRADDFTLRDLPNRAEPLSARLAGRRVVPLASIPWKRDSDTYAAVTVNFAQLPWLRRVDEPDGVMLPSADLPWLRRITTYTAVDVQTAALPWRH